MQATPPLTRTIGKTERTLQAVLHRQLALAGLTFPEWTILTFLGRGPLPRAEVVKLVEDGRIAASADAQATIEAMIAKRLISAEGGRLAVTEDGAALYAPVRPGY
jgi:DNA-binding MarR family transcriptional regulator